MTSRKVVYPDSGAPGMRTISPRRRTPEFLGRKSEYNEGVLVVGRRTCGLLFEQAAAAAVSTLRRTKGDQFSDGICTGSQEKAVEKNQNCSPE